MAKYHKRPRPEPTDETALAGAILLGPFFFIGRWIWRAVLRQNHVQLS